MTTPPPFNCLTPKGFVAGGKKYEVTSIATIEHMLTGFVKSYIIDLGLEPDLAN